MKSDLNIETIKKERSFNSVIFATGIIVSFIGLGASLYSRAWLQAMLWVTILLADVNIKLTQSRALFWKENYVIVKDLIETIIDHAKKENERSQTSVK